jgi:hypothetical protein
MEEAQPTYKRESPDGVHCVGCYESRSAHAMDIEVVARLEHEPAC